MPCSRALRQRGKTFPIRPHLHPREGVRQDLGEIEDTTSTQRRTGVLRGMDFGIPGSRHDRALPSLPELRSYPLH